MDSATKVNAEMCKDSVRLLGALIVVENMPAMMGRLVMCGKKSREIQAPVLVIVTASLLEVRRVEHRHVLEIGESPAVRVVF